MVNLDFPWDPELCDRLDWNEWVEKKENFLISKITRGVWIALAWLMFSSEPTGTDSLVDMSNNKYVSFLESEEIDTAWLAPFFSKFWWFIESLDTIWAMNQGHLLDAIDLYNAYISDSTPEWYADQYDAFIAPYSNPDLDIIKLLAEVWIPYHGLI